MQQLLEQAQELERSGRWQDSFEIYEKLLAEYPQHPTLLCLYGMCLFTHQRYEQALDVLVKYYRYTEDTDIRIEIFEYIFKAYYAPNAEQIRETYKKNAACLLQYEHNYLRKLPEYEQLPFVCIPRSDREYYIFSKETGQFYEQCFIMGESGQHYELTNENSILVRNMFDAQTLYDIEQKTTASLENNMKLPLYILWEGIDYLVHLQVQDFQPLVQSNRVVFFSERGEAFFGFFQNPQSIIPYKILAGDRYLKEIQEQFENIFSERSVKKQAKLEVVQQLANQFDRDYYKELLKGDVSNLRMLFFTSRFTRVVQHSTRDFMKACQDQGITCELLIDASDIQRAGEEALIDKIAQFRPNIIFRINYFKMDFKVIPQNILFLTWMQDPGYQIYTPKIAQCFSWNDFALALPGWHRCMLRTGFEPTRIANQLLPFNERMFYPRLLSCSELKGYGAAVALPSNYNMPGDALADLISLFSENAFSSGTTAESRKKLTRLFVRAYDIFRAKIEEGQLIASIRQCAEIILEISTTLGISLTQKEMNTIADEFYNRICYGIHRRTTLKWVADAGFDLKLWGRDWEKDDFLKKYAHGVLAHGEDLAKMYSATKIILATFSHYTGHFRVFEALACGALPLLRYVPQERDLADFRDTFKESEHFVFYYGQQDLIEKLNYYLTHEEERRRIVENGRKAALQSMTYASVVDNFLSLVKHNLT